MAQPIKRLKRPAQPTRYPASYGEYRMSNGDTVWGYHDPNSDFIAGVLNPGQASYEMGSWLVESSALCRGAIIEYNPPVADTGSSGSGTGSDTSYGSTSSCEPSTPAHEAPSTPSAPAYEPPASDNSAPSNDYSASSGGDYS